MTKLKDGESGIIVSVSTEAGRHHGHHRRTLWHNHRWGFQRRLEDMGLTPGTKVTVVKSAPFHGPVELLVRGSRLALGRGMAERIIVRVEK